MSSSNAPFLSAGVDIGTTTISLTVANITGQRQELSFNLPNRSSLPASESFRHEQDPECILACVTDALNGILTDHPGIRAIGLTGQMHGFVYTDADGLAVSPLYTWQDVRAAEPFDDSRSYCEEIYRRTGETIRPGYGFATHFYNAENGLVPETAVSLCTIMDYIAMRLTGRKRPLMHPSNAAGLGLFSAADSAFQTSALEKLGGPKLDWPEIAADCSLVGWHRGIPVITAIGDNQASFFGSVSDEEGSILLNYGTGSQISLLDPDPSLPICGPLERRPHLNGRYLLCGCALCGGRAYALLERFFHLYQQAAGQGDHDQYETLNTLAEEALEKGYALPVRTTFCGTRQDPGLLGMISGISEENFTPGALTLGILRGMADELHALLPANQSAARRLIASGNAVRKNSAFQKVLSAAFGLPLLMPAISEEAAFGAALSAACFSGQGISLEAVKACIH